MSNQLTHAEIERIIDDQERELDSLIRASGTSGSCECDGYSDQLRPCLAERMKKAWRALLMRLKLLR